jgi:hypothetical protein
MEERNGFEMFADGSDCYTDAQINFILKKAEALGLPLEKGTHVEKMTIKQLARLTNGVYDA